MKNGLIYIFRLIPLLILNQIITIKEQKKGVEVIATIDYNNEKVSYFRPKKFENVESNKQQDSDNNQFIPPVITELYLVTAQVRKNGISILVYQSNILWKPKNKS